MDDQMPALDEKSQCWMNEKNLTGFGEHHGLFALMRFILREPLELQQPFTF
jgi:hypothetical protein